jgi:hypothetical protein
MDARGTRAAHEARAPRLALGPALEAWRGALAAWVAALAAYEKEAGQEGPRTLGTRWRAAVRAIIVVADAVYSAPPDGIPAAGAAALRALMALADTYETSEHQLAAAEAAYLDPNVQAALMVGMSQTFSENLRSFVRGVRGAAAEARAKHKDALAAATDGGSVFAELGAADIEAAFRAAPIRGGVATELYLSALLCQDSAQAAALLEAAKDVALGCRDTAEAAAADTAALAAYHPLQAMSYAPMPSSTRAGAAGAGATTVDLSLPQAGLHATYDLARLTDRQRALEYGPMATMFSGLSYKLVERLRTIAVEPRMAGPGAEAGLEAGVAGSGIKAIVTGPFRFTTDGGRTFREMYPAPYDSTVSSATDANAADTAGKADAADAADTADTTGAAGGSSTKTWAPFAGARPRVEAYANAMAAIIFERLRAERAEGWGPDLRQRFEAAVRAGTIPAGECASEALIAALALELEKAYDLDPPKTPGAYRELVVPEEMAPESYIASAVSRLSAAATEAALQGFLAATVQRLPYAAVEREARLTQALRSLDAARLLWARLRKAYKEDAEAFELPPPKQKDALLRAFRRTAAAALAVAPLLCSPPAVKIFAARTIGRV